MANRTPTGENASADFNRGVQFAAFVSISAELARTQDEGRAGFISKLRGRASVRPLCFSHNPLRCMARHLVLW